MKKNQPQFIALRTASIVAGIYVILYVLYFLFFIDDFHALFFAISIVMLFALVYLVVWRAIENFIYKKIRLLYKTIHNLKTSKQKAVPGAAWFEDAEKEVISWAEEQQAEMENLKKLEQYRRNFIGNVSHELKTPIFNIQGYVETLLDGGIDDPSINRSYLEKAGRNIDRMISIVNDLDEISKLESGTHALKLVKFDVHQLANEVLEMMEKRAAEKDIRLFMNPNASASALVIADKELIRQAISNLVINAIKYTMPGGRVKLSFYDMDEQILLEVSDNGIGISQEDLPHIYDRFYRSEAGRSVDNSGSGLGLAIVKHIIEAHHQTVNVRSTVSVGTTFGITLKKG